MRPRTSSTGGAPTYRPASDTDLRKRTEFLQEHGYTAEGAERKAKGEAAARAWRSEGSSDWAREREREARNAANEKMEKDLAELDPN